MAESTIFTLTIVGLYLENAIAIESEAIYQNSPAAKRGGGGVTQSSDIVFFPLLIIHLWGVYNDI